MQVPAEHQTIGSPQPSTVITVHRNPSYIGVPPNSLKRRCVRKAKENPGKTLVLFIFLGVLIGTPVMVAGLTKNWFKSDVAFVVGVTPPIVCLLLGYCANKSVNHAEF